MCQQLVYSYVPGFVRQCLESLLPASWQECFPFHSENTNDCLQLCTFSILRLEFLWQSFLANMAIILTCSRLSILLSNKLWAFAGGRPSKSQQRLLNHTFTSWLIKSRYKSFFWQDLRVLKYSIKMLTSTDQGTVFTLLHMIFGKIFSPGRLVSRREGRLQAHHDVLHHSRAGASIHKVVMN